jgi:hypothetical protein
MRNLQLLRGFPKLQRSYVLPHSRSNREREIEALLSERVAGELVEEVKALIQKDTKRELENVRFFKEPV